MNYDPEIHMKPPSISDWENHYLTMFIALENWHIVPWINSKTHEEYPEIKYSMYKLLEYKNNRALKDYRKAKKDAELASKNRR